MARLPPGLRTASHPFGPGTLGGLRTEPLRLQDLTQLLTGLLPLFSQRRPAPSPRRHSFEKGDWLAELELLQLAQELKTLADQRGGFEAELFDLMVSIADVLELDHGWQRSQSNQWLVRMGLWEEDLSAGA